MKKKNYCIILIVLLIRTSCFADTSEAMHRQTSCIKWKKVCLAQTECAQGKQTNRSAPQGCFKCVKPSKWGFHNYPRQPERSTCNEGTAEYLRNMGYHCYRPSDAETACVQNKRHETCDSVCMEYAKQSK